VNATPQQRTGKQWYVFPNYELKKCHPTKGALNYTLIPRYWLSKLHGISSTPASWIKIFNTVLLDPELKITYLVF
jgi:hypothetical protein